MAVKNSNVAQEFRNVQPIPFIFAGERTAPNGARIPGQAIEPTLYTVHATQDDWAGHGTMVSSKVVGVELGTAKRANLIAVKLPEAINKSERLPQIHLTSVIDGLAKIAIDVLSRQSRTNRIGWAVINMSFGLAPPQDVNAQIQDFIRQFLNVDVVITTSSGNCRDRPNDCPHVSLASSFLFLVRTLSSLLSTC
jgi:hypothetical protein